MAVNQDAVRAFETLLEQGPTTRREFLTVLGIESFKVAGSKDPVADYVASLYRQARYYKATETNDQTHRVYEIGRYNQNEQDLGTDSKTKSVNSWVKPQLQIGSDPVDIRERAKNGYENWIENIPENLRPTHVTFNKHALGSQGSAQYLSGMSTSHVRTLAAWTVSKLREDHFATINQNWYTALDNLLQETENRTLFIEEFKGTNGYLQLATFAQTNMQATHKRLSSQLVKELEWKFVTLLPQTARNALTFIEENFDQLTGFDGYLWLADQNGWTLKRTYENVSALLNHSNHNFDDLNWQQIPLTTAQQAREAKTFIEQNFDQLKDFDGYLRLAEQTGWTLKKTYPTVSALLNNSNHNFDDLNWQATQLKTPQEAREAKTFIEQNFNQLKDFDGYLWLAEETGWTLQKTYGTVSALLNHSQKNFNHLNWQEVQLTTAQQARNARAFIEENFDQLTGFDGYLWLAEQNGWTLKKTFMIVSALLTNSNHNFDDLNWQATQLKTPQEAREAKTFIEQNFNQLKDFDGYLWLAEETGWTPLTTFMIVSALLNHSHKTFKHLNWQQIHLKTADQTWRLTRHIETDGLNPTTWKQQQQKHKLNTKSFTASVAAIANMRNLHRQGQTIHPRPAI